VLSITTTALGRVEGRALLREGARVGDRVFVTGAPGAAALGLRALRAGRGDEARFAPFVRAWRACWTSLWRSSIACRRGRRESEHLSNRNWNCH